MIEYIALAAGGVPAISYTAYRVVRKLVTKPEDLFILESRRILTDAGYEYKKVSYDPTYDSRSQKHCNFCDSRKYFIQVFENRINPRGEAFIRKAEIGSGNGCLRCRYIDATQSSIDPRRLLFEEHFKIYSLNHKEKQPSTPFRD